MDHPEYFAVAFVEEVSVPRYHLDQSQLRHRQVVRAALVKDQLFPHGEGIPTRCAAPVDLPLRNLRLTWFWKRDNAMLFTVLVVRLRSLVPRYLGRVVLTPY